MTDDVTRQAAAALMDDVAEEMTSEQPAPEAVPEPEPDLPSWQADTTGLDFLEDEDDEPEAPAPVEDEPDEEPEWDEDPAASKLRKDLATANKKLAWSEEQRINSSRKNWREEAGRRFPLSSPDEIAADSRRAFLKKANEQQVKMEKRLGPILQQVQKLREDLIVETKAEVRQEAQTAWGKPSFGAPAVEQTQAAEDAAKYKPSAYKRLEDLTLAKLKGGVLDIG